VARPRSEDRRNAILAAAADLVAEKGLGAATAEIAKRAGIPHGSIFTYFETKSDLLNVLYLELSNELADSIMAAMATQEDTQSRFRSLWVTWTLWGVANPKKRRAQAQLTVSEQVTGISRAVAYSYGESIFELLREVSAKGVLRDAPLIYIGSLVDSWAATTTDFMIRDPGAANSLCDAGFEAARRALA
jgi:AcrR family transcriptional regulator